MPGHLEPQPDVELGGHGRATRVKSTIAVWGECRAATPGGVRLDLDQVPAGSSQRTSGTPLARARCLDVPQGRHSVVVAGHDTLPHSS